jgi:biotin operon repressor
VVIAVDDLDLIPDFRQTMVLLRNTAMELGLSGARVMIVVAGTPVLFERMWEAHAPLVRFFEPLELGRLPEEAAVEAITKPLVESGVRFEPEVVERIVQLSQGQPYYLQELAYHAFETAQDGAATAETFALAFERAFSTIAKAVFERRVAGLSTGEQKLLGVVVSLDGPAAHGEIVAQAVQAGLKRGSVAKLLQRLREKGCVRQVESGPQKGRYFVEDPLFVEYVRRRVVEPE